MSKYHFSVNTLAHTRSIVVKLRRVFLFQYLQQADHSLGENCFGLFTGIWQTENSYQSFGLQGS